MKSTPKTEDRILAIAPNSRGFGFVVLDGEYILANSGGKEAKGDKNKEALRKVNELMAFYLPTLLILEDTSVKTSRRDPRIKKLIKDILKLAASRKLRVKQFSREKVHRTYFADGSGTKQELAELLAKQFPAGASLQSPPERKEWKSEHYRMGIFDALALALMPQMLKKLDQHKETEGGQKKV